MKKDTYEVRNLGYIRMSRPLVCMFHVCTCTFVHNSRQKYLQDMENYSFAPSILLYI